ncbi:MAG: nucleotidyl transferase AbiEii/AbiGii toxin family protein [Deltaproteobacteria bacterium]|nr:nucleotidyl transferase AbiEii/AbiGii toxin family protein [Deltaproteobacteria bacterium]
MKTYRDVYIRKAELAQLILLDRLYAQKESRHLIFQGGTAIRWCFGGSRFSEDLDFVTPINPEKAGSIVQAAVRGAEKLMVPHFGAGEVVLNPKKELGDAFKCFVDFRPQTSREKISVKLEFEGLEAGKLPDIHNHVMGTLSPVAYLIATGEFRIPRPHTVIVSETPAEILSDKVRALLERRYLKGRDFFDLWHLYAVMKAPADTAIVQRKFTLYREAFTARRSADFFIRPAEPDKAEMLAAIEKDLSRFLPDEVLSVHRSRGYVDFLAAARDVFSELRTKGARLP